MAEQKALLTFASQYELTLDFKRPTRGTVWPNAKRYIRANNDAEAVSLARELITRETEKRRGGWVPIPESAKLTSVVTLREEVSLV